MKTFTCYIVNGREFTVEADFITQKTSAAGSGPSGGIFFWRKPHWWSRLECVGILDWAVVAAVWQAVPSKTSADIAKELGVKL